MNLTEKLGLKLEPIGIFFGNTTAQCDLEPTADTRNCVIPFLMTAGHGKVVGMTEETCNCPGGSVGCCFGDGFTRRNPMIHKMLSQGFGDMAPPGMPEHLKEGERFFCTDELAMKWRNAMPFSDKGYPRIVFAPVSRWEEIGTPDLVYLFADPDQLSVLVTQLGFHNGRAMNTIAPYGAACHSILFAAEQMEKEDPMAVMGLFDISQRRAGLANYLSLTVTYPMWEGMNRDLDKSCLTTHSWQEIEKRR
ncbi:MAG: DUF169 domain-containing protein [Ruminiclostridium sp.]|nr:DUF169 domain-containing protein [Ruminiclostridium sp.]MBQ9851379.1 DUF169 domain-containing protein [Ruminiclostridium sp.]MBQ9933464.1 DUF169 domain-containing protein [Ruminiclostridium sp.]